MDPSCKFYDWILLLDLFLLISSILFYFLPSVHYLSGSFLVSRDYLLRFKVCKEYYVGVNEYS